MDILQNINLIQEEKNKKNDFKKLMIEKLDKILQDIELSENMNLEFTNRQIEYND